MSKYLEVDFSREFYVDCVCAECGDELVVEWVDNIGSEITVCVEPCKQCNGNGEVVTVFDTQSPFFKDLMEFTEKEFGREAAQRVELFALTWHGGKDKENE